jgi:hypothetical protein
MKTWNYALYLSLASVVFLIIIFFLPGEYSIFVSNKSGRDVGVLFPVMLLIWILSLVAFALNNVFVDKCYIDNDIRMHPLVKYLPSLFGTPVLFSFIWFLYTMMKGISPA